MTIIDMLNILRMWDFVAAQRPDLIIANSNEVQKRIKKFYNRTSTVIYPPVDTNLKQKEIKTQNKNYYLALGRLSKYKNFDKIIEAFSDVVYQCEPNSDESRHSLVQKF